MDGEESPTQRLAQRITARRRELGLTGHAAAALAGMARNTWTSAEKGTRRTSDANYSGIEDALRWTRGSVAAILAGGEPTDRPGATKAYTYGASGPTVHYPDDSVAEDLRTIDSLPLSAKRKLELMQQYLRLVKEADDEASKAS